MAKANRRYFTLATKDTKDGGVFAPQFGDYDRECVVAEMEEYKARGEVCRIVSSGDSQADIVAAVAKLNSKIAS
jgi:hypothetical protein